MQNFKKKKVIVITVLAVMLVVLVICGIHKIVKVWKYKSCNTKYISIKQYDNLEIPKVKPEKVTDDLIDFSLVQYLQNENLKQHDT